MTLKVNHFRSDTWTTVSLASSVQTSHSTPISYKKGQKQTNNIILCESQKQINQNLSSWKTSIYSKPCKPSPVFSNLFVYCSLSIDATGTLFTNCDLSSLGQRQRQAAKVKSKILAVCTLFGAHFNFCDCTCVHFLRARRANCLQRSCR